MKMFKFFALLVMPLVFAGCAVTETDGGEESRTITLMTWNLHNLFDGKDDGFEYSQFTQAGGWSAEKYKGRLNTLSAAIGKIEPAPEIIIFQEIESLTVLKDLVAALSSEYWGHFANNEGAAVGIGVISKFPLTDAKAHSITINGNTTPRPVLEARVSLEGGDIILFACHWKSKIGGENETEDARMASANVIIRRIGEIWESEPCLGIIIAGDLNLNHDDFIRRGSNSLCALVPDNSAAARLAEDKKNYIVISGQRPPEPFYFPDGTIVLYSPWFYDLENGSYYYRNNWETIDHFLISRHFFDNAGFEYDGAFIADFEPFVTERGLPASYNPRTGCGLSDHLPLLVKLRK